MSQDWREWGPGDPIVEEPVSPMAGWQVAVANPRFGGGEGSLQRFEWPRAPGGDVSISNAMLGAHALIHSDPGLQLELDRLALRAESRRRRDDGGGGVVRNVDLPVNPLGGGGFGGVDRYSMEHTQSAPHVSQDVRSNAAVAVQSAVPRRCNASQHSC